MVDMHLGNIRQVTNLSSRKCKRYVGMMFASMVISLSVGLSATATAVPQPNEVTVFGSEDRSATLNSFSNNILEHVQESVVAVSFNGKSQVTRAVSLVARGELVIESGHVNGLYEKYFNGFGDIISMEMMAEKLIIRSALFIKGTNVSIYARELIFEGRGRIITTPDDYPIAAVLGGITIPKTPSTEANPEPLCTVDIREPGNGMPGLPAGSVKVHAQTGSFDQTAVLFSLVGGNGQDASQGVHGIDAPSLPFIVRHARHAWGCFTHDGDVYSLPGITNCDNGDDATNTVQIDQWKAAGRWGVTGISSQSIDYRYRFGQFDPPKNGCPAQPAGTPGKGGAGGSIISYAPRAFDFERFASPFGGQPGKPGRPEQTTYHKSVTLVEGGRAGTPINSVRLVTYGDNIKPLDDPDTAFVSTDPGKEGGTVQIGEEGTIGLRNGNVSSYSWLHPQLMRHILNGIKDDYLQNRISKAKAALIDYSTQIEAYRVDINTPKDKLQFELEQMYNEMQVLRAQIANGQDYFGNPNGYVPMLSFEVSLAAFDKEIDRSLDMIFLAKWISSNSKSAERTLAGLATARANLNTEIENTKDEYDDALQALAAFSIESDEMTLRVKNLQNRLVSKDNQLRFQAFENTKPSDWEVALRVGLKVAGSIAEMVPVYQPALGAAGGALIVSADFDPDEPWDTVIGLAGVAETYAASGIKEAAAAQKAEKDGVATGTNADRIKSLQQLSAGSQSISKAITGISVTLERSKAPQSEIDRELAKLRQGDEEFKALADEISQLLNDRRIFTDKMAAATNNIARLSDLITRNILTIDTLDVEVVAQGNVINPSVNSYLKDLERRAFDRLLKFHYFMAKAYEYRVVEAYTGTLDLESLLDGIESTLGENAIGTMTTPQRDAIKSIYKDLIASIATEILSDITAGNQTIKSDTVTLSLSQDQLDTLNTGNIVNVNLFEVENDLFSPSRDDIRIREIRLVNDQLTAELADGVTESTTSNIYIDIDHSGISDLNKDGKVYQFRHYNNETRTPINWTLTYDLANPSNSNAKQPIPATASLISSLVDIDTSQQLAFSRPSAWADLILSRGGVNGNVRFDLGDEQPPLLLKEVRLSLTYDYIERSSNTREVYISARGNISEKLLAGFTLSEPDRNDRQDGKGDMLRIFNNSSTNATIIAERDVDGYTFSKWTANGSDYGADPTNPVAIITKNDDYRMVAVYEVAAPVIISGGLASGFNDAEFNYQILTGRNQAASYEAENLPAGLSLNAASGLISGVPTTTSSQNVTLYALTASGLRSQPKNLLINMLGVVRFRDETGNDGSLRGAIDRAPAGSTVLFSSSMDSRNGFLNLDSPLIISKNVTIDASNLPSGVSISGKGLVRVMEILPGVEVTLKGITIANGNAVDENGGGILNNGTLTLVNSTLDGNGAQIGGAIYNSNTGTLNVLSSTLSNNAAQDGGAIGNAGALTMMNTTITKNTALGTSGGGGLFNDGGIASIINSTIVENEAPDGSGGGISNGGLSSSMLTIENSIIADNIAALGDDIRTGNGSAINTNGNNLIGDIGDSGLVSDSVLIAPAQLAVLGNYGGKTQTMPPLVSSPALEAAVMLPSTPLTDQLGANRPIGSRPDLGAVELDAIPVLDRNMEAIGFSGFDFEYQIAVSVGITSFVATELPPGLDLDPLTGIVSGIPTVSGDYNVEVSAINPIATSTETLFITINDIQAVSTIEDRVPGSLREMLMTYPAGATITFDPSLSGETIVLDSFGLSARDINIDASSLPDGLTIDVNGNGSVFNTSGDVTFNSLTIKGGSGDLGGGIVNFGNLTLLNSTLRDNSADYGGAAIYNIGELRVVNSTFYNNRCLGYGGLGGAIYHDGVNRTIVNSMTIVNSTLTGNQALEGGAIYYLSGPITIENTIIAGNTADTGADIQNSSGGNTFLVLGNNLIGDNSSVETIFEESALVGTLDNPLDAQLAAFGLYGGPTETMPPLPNSPAVNAGVLLETTPNTDQKGAPRVSGVLPDIGAVELQETANIGSLQSEDYRQALVSPQENSILVNGGNFSVFWDRLNVSGSLVDMYILQDDPSNIDTESGANLAILQSRNWFKFATQVANSGEAIFATNILNGNGNAYKLLLVSDFGIWTVNQGTFEIVTPVPDTDNDGIPDTADTYPGIPIGNLLDTDNDGAPNDCDAACLSLGMAADADDDDDGILDVNDVYPLTNIGNLPDTDKDGAPNDCDAVCLSLGMTADNDDDNDGILDVNDTFPLISIRNLLDTDNDGAPDDCDEACLSSNMNADDDDDNDGVLDINDAFRQIAIGDLLDTDNDGAPDECDAACISLGMAADTDDDNDGVLDVDDAFPLDPTKSQNSTQKKVKNDLDGDGKSDLLWRSSALGWNFLWSMDGVKTKQAKPINVVQDEGWLMAGQGDYDSDGHSDIFWRNTLTGMNFIYLMDGLTIKTRKVLNFVDSPQWELRGSGDFNGDGKGDVLWRDVDRGRTHVYLMDGVSIGTNQPLLLVTDLNYKIMAIGDINGDGTDDVIWRNQLTGVNYIWIMANGQIASRYVLNTINGDWTIVGAGDLDGDGTDDIILRNQVDGRNWVYLMEDGLIKTSELMNTVGDINWQIANMGDYDGDGKTDILWRNELDARNIVHLMDGLTIKDRGVLRPTDSSWTLAK